VRGSVSEEERTFPSTATVNVTGSKICDLSCLMLTLRKRREACF
jgi:hypothetical protein